MGGLRIRWSNRCRANDPLLAAPVLPSHLSSARAPARTRPPPVPDRPRFNIGRTRRGPAPTAGWGQGSGPPALSAPLCGRRELRRPDARPGPGGTRAGAAGTRPAGSCRRSPPWAGWARAPAQRSGLECAESMQQFKFKIIRVGSLPATGSEERTGVCPLGNSRRMQRELPVRS